MSILIPQRCEEPQYVFLLEELENNLHPAVQRRLFQYLRKKAGPRMTFFITTHSNVVIDLFRDDQDVQLVHVTNKETVATVVSVKTPNARVSVINDLGARASDMLQANGIIWVEGPSGRIYVNCWIQLYGSGALVEHVHYVCLWYGGSSRSHIAFGDRSDQERAGFVADALRVNRNAVVIMDSDKGKHEDTLASWVAQVRDILEAGDSGMIAGSRSGS